MGTVDGAGRPVNEFFEPQDSSRPDPQYAVMNNFNNFLDDGALAAFMAAMMFTSFRPDIKPHYRV